jgi:transposase
VRWRKYQDRGEPERLGFIETLIETWTRTVVTDNLGTHNAVRELIRIADAKPFSLSKYSAELNLIEQIFAKLKHSPRDAARSVETGCAVIARSSPLLPSSNAQTIFSGYA